jgi:hypothetical protein
MRIGIDFDNTIAAYDHAFLSAAQQWHLLPEQFHGSKKDIRDAIRRRPDGEHRWQRLQGYVYGKQMQHAKLFPGVDEFLLLCKQLKSEVYIISHKTEFAHFDEDHTNLRDAAWAWMQAHDFFEKTGFAIPPGNVFFHDSRDEKISQVEQTGCDVFIDDLEEIFLDPDFPPNVKKLLFTPGISVGDSRSTIQAFSAWDDIKNELFPRH